MPLIIFIDALPFSFIEKNKSKLWMKNMHFHQLIPNIGYSSNLHWQLFANKYPDELGFFTDWAFQTEPSWLIKLVSKIFSFTDSVGNTGVLVRKILDRIVFRRNVFANIPFRFRGYFRENPKYMLFNSESVRTVENLKNYEIILDDELRLEYGEMLRLFNTKVTQGFGDIFISFGFADKIGHELSRCSQYDAIIEEKLIEIFYTINLYKEINKNQEVIIVSDHGMSNIIESIDIGLQNEFGNESRKKYIAYKDSAILRVFVFDKSLENPMQEYLTKSRHGHLLNDEERVKYGVDSRQFGDLIFLLFDGYVFADNWFGKTLRKKKIEYGMHGFWPDSLDQQAVFISPDNLTDSSILTYEDFYSIFTKVTSNAKK